MSSNLEAFNAIVEGQVPNMAQRMKAALDDPEVQDHFDMVGQVNDFEYLYFLNHLAMKYGLPFDDAEEVYFRLDIRRHNDGEA